MKKSNLIASLLIVCFITISYAGSVTPVLGMRFNDITGSTSKLPGPTTSVGLKMQVSEGVYTGFDSAVDGNDFRIFVEQSFGKIGLGISGTSPTFTVGAIYNVYSNLNVEMEYMINQLVPDDEDTENINESLDQLRLSLSITF